MNNLDIQNIEKVIGYKYKDKDLLEVAFTHSSYANENDTLNYERLEFLGDSLLGCIASEYLYTHYKDNEGELTKIKSRVVSAKSLFMVMEEMELSKYIRVGLSINRNHIPLNIVADVFESIVASIYLDSNMENAKEFVLKKLIKSNENIKEILQELVDYKTELQEVLQAKGMHANYVSTELRDGDFVKFEIQLIINDKVVATDISESKKDGEQACAKKFLKNSGGLL